MGQMYLQKQEATMGTCCAPSYANIYLGGWKRWIFSDEQFDRWLNKVLYWFRDIDDLLIIWAGPRDELRAFLDTLNNNDFNLRFTYTFSSSSIAFLDLTIMINDEGDLSLYRKPSSGNTILHASSAHPVPLIRSIPYA